MRKRTAAAFVPCGLFIASCGEPAAQVPSGSDASDVAEVQADSDDSDSSTPDTSQAADTRPEADTLSREDAGDTSPQDVGTDTAPPKPTEGDGRSCLSPRVVSVPADWTEPVVVNGDTRGRGDDHAIPEETCGDIAWAEGLGAADEAWSFKAPRAGVYRIELTSLGEDVGLYVLAGCETGTATVDCRGGMDWSDDGPWVDVVSLRLEANERIDVIVDGWKEGYEGPYELAFQPPAVEAPGNRCENARMLAEAGDGTFVGTGDLISNPGLTDDYSAIGCGSPAPGGRGTGDEVWSFVAPTTGAWKAVVTPAEGKDAMVYAFRPGACAERCAAYADESTNGPETLDLGTLEQGARIELVVDAWWFFDAGPYELRVMPATP